MYASGKPIRPARCTDRRRQKRPLRSTLCSADPTFAADTEPRVKQLAELPDFARLAIGQKMLRSSVRSPPTYQADRPRRRWQRQGTRAHMRRNRCILQGRYKAFPRTRISLHLSLDECNRRGKRPHMSCLWFRYKVRQLRKPF